MSSTNPILGLAIYSLMNALELYQKGDERHRFGAIILMDLSVEYVLKAKLYELNPTEYMEKGEDLGFYDVLNDDKIDFVGDEKKLLTKVHGVRNYAQHRGAIPDSLAIAQYMDWLCNFVKRFALDDFGLEIKLPPNLNRTWIKLTLEEKTTSDKLFILKKPIEDNYRTAKNWIRKREQKAKRGWLAQNYRNQLLYHLRKFCEFVKKTPDELIEDAKKGFPTDELLLKFLATKSTPSPYQIAIKSFFDQNNVEITVPPMPDYKPVYSTYSITTEQIRKICDVATLPHKSWILATSYMGLNVGEIAKLKVADFHRENWKTSKLIYPVKIREEVSNTFDYTTFIAEDAKKVLEIYFDEKGFGSQDQPWGHINPSTLSAYFRIYANNANLYVRGSQYKFTPKILVKRLKNILSDSGMRYGWVCYILGLIFKGAKFDRPLDAELTKAYEKALPKLKVYDVTEVLNSKKKFQQQKEEEKKQAQHT